MRPMRGDSALRDASASFLDGGGELGALMRAHDWSATPLGSPARWPRSLKTAVRIMLTSRQPIWIGYGPELTYLYNDPYKSIIGGKHPRALGLPFREVWSEIWDVVGPLADTVMTNDEGIYVETQLLIMARHGYEEETYYTFSYSPIPDDAGGPCGLICANTDDTRRVIGERQLASLREIAACTANARTVEAAYELAAKALATNDRDLPFVLIYSGDPPALAASAGIDPARAAALSFGDALVAGGVIELDSALGELPSGAWQRPPHQAVVIPLSTNAQGVRSGWLVAALNPFRKLDSDYRGFLELAASQVATAVASARAYDEERKRAEALAELDRAKTVFFSNVSHEFRTPLTLMLAPVEDLLAKPADEVQPADRAQLALVHRNGQRLLKLVNTLLDFARIEAGRMQASFEPVDLGVFTAELASNFRSACERAGLRLSVDCDPAAEPAFVDREAWEKIVLNLVSNAFKFTLAGEIGVRLIESPSGFELKVRDTGTGIPEHELPHMFERFHRVDGARGRSHEGSGIGLALAQELVKLHGGTISVESVAGSGTTFTVRIPKGSSHLAAERVKSASGAATAAPRAGAFVAEALSWLAAPAEESPPTVATGKPKVLLADDNADLREYARRLLSQDYDVEAVSDGEAALASARARKPDLVVSDVMMPGLDGFGLIRALRADPELVAVPVILLSARAGEEARLEGLGRGADDYLVKPFSARELLMRAATLLESARIRREGEERFRLLADGAPALIWVNGPQGAEFVNRGYLDFLGVDPPDVRGFDWAQFVHPDDREGYVRGYLQAMERKESFDAEFRFRRHDGAYRWMRTVGRPRLGPGGEFLGCSGITIDITEGKRAEEALREADRAKDEFLATLSHELRNPLAPLRNSLELLRHSGAGSSIAQPVQAIMERQVNHLVRLVDDLMELSRITRGSFELRREPLELQAVLKNAVETARPLIDAAKHRLDLRLPSEPLMLEADAVRLGQVFANMLNNAAKYTPEGGDIALEAHRDGNVAVVTVSDTGEGIDSKQLPRLFEMFSQIDRTARRSQGGLGIGLALARRLAEMHGGSVEAESDGLGKGSRFTVRLPLGSAASVAAGKAHEHRRLSPQRVLVVDDNRDAAVSLGMLLGSLGADVRVAHDGPSALSEFDAHRPAIVLLDIGMPGMDGYDVARAIRNRADGARVPLVALTGWGQADDRDRAAEAGFDHHLVKPADIGTLQALMASYESRAPG